MFAILFLLTVMLLATILALASLRRRRRVIGVGLGLAVAMAVFSAAPAKADGVTVFRTGFGNRAVVVDDSAPNLNFLTLPAFDVGLAGVAFAPRVTFVRDVGPVVVRDPVIFRQPRVIVERGLFRDRVIFRR